MPDIVLNAQITDANNSAMKAAKNAARVDRSFRAAGKSATTLESKSKGIGASVGTAGTAAGRLKAMLGGAVTVAGALGAATKIAAAQIEQYREGLQNVYDTAAAMSSLRGGIEAGILPKDALRTVESLKREMPWVQKTMLLQAAQVVGAPAAQAGVDLGELLKGIVGIWFEQGAKGDLKRISKTVATSLLTGTGTGLARYGYGISPAGYEGMGMTERIAAVSEDLIKTFQKRDVVGRLGRRPSLTQLSLLEKTRAETRRAEYREAEAGARSMEEIMYQRYVSEMQRRGVDVTSFWGALGDNFLSGLSAYFQAQTMNPRSFWARNVGRGIGLYPDEGWTNYLEGRRRVNVAINRTPELERE